MKVWHWVTIAVGVAALATVGVIVLTPSGDRPWVSNPAAPSADHLRIASFCVEGLYDHDDDPRLTGANDDIPSDESHLEAIASAIRSLDADILALQDVESLAAVEWFNQTYLSELGYEHIASLDVGHERGSENAVLSRYRIKEKFVWPTRRLGGKHPSTIDGARNPQAGQNIMFRRSPLMVTIDIPDEAPLSMMVVEHKGGDKYAYWRKAEATAIAELCKEFGMSNRILVLGSFHCDPSDPSLQPYFDVGFSDPMANSGDSEYHATEISGDRTDFILANRSVGGDLDPDTGFVLGGELAERIGSGEAEMTHLPVVISLRLHED